MVTKTKAAHDQDATDHESEKPNPALAPVPLDAFETDLIPEDEWGDYPLQTSRAAERDETQVHFDQQVKDLLDKWNEAGNPTRAKSPRKRVRTAPEHVASINRMLGRAARLHGVAVTRDPVKHDAEGRATIVFTVGAQQKRKAAKKDDASE